MFKKIWIAISLVYNIIVSIFMIILLLLIIFNYFNFNNNKKYYIIYQTNDKRYIEYYPKIELLKSNDSINIKEFSYKNYESFCYCKNNKKYRIYDKNICFMSKECDNNIQISTDYFKLKSFSIWKDKNIYDNKQIYHFFQGISNITGRCDKNFNYTKCGFLLDINTDFCIKNYEICPFDNINTSFYLKNLTNDVEILYYDKNIKINDIYKMEEFFPHFLIKNKSINYEVFDTSDLYNLVFDNNIPYLKEVINNTMKNIKLELVQLKMDNTNIKTSDTFFQEKQILDTYPNIYVFFSNIILFIGYFFFILTIFGSINTGYLYTIKKQKSILDFIGFFFGGMGLGVVIILYFIFLYYYHKDKIEKESLLNEEYYKTIKSILIIIKYFILLIIASGNNFITILLQKIFFCKKCKDKNQIVFVQIQ